MDATLTIASSILDASPINYEITSGAQYDDTFEQASVTSSTAESTCPTTYEFAVINQSGTAIDSAVFNYDVVTATFIVNTSDIAKVASYPLRIQVKYVGYAVAGSQDFTVNILSACMDATLTLDSSIISATSIQYKISDFIQFTETFPQSAVTSSTTEPTCPTTFAFSMINQNGSAIDTSVFTYMGATSLFEAYTEDLNKIATYPLRIQAQYFETSCNPVCSGGTPCKHDTTNACLAYTSGTSCAVSTTDCSTVTAVVYPVAGTYDFTINVSNGCDFSTLDLEYQIQDQTVLISSLEQEPIETPFIHIGDSGCIVTSTYSITDDLPVSKDFDFGFKDSNGNFESTSSSQLSLQFQSTDITLVGIYLITYTITIEEDALQLYSTEFFLNIQLSCEFAQFSAAFNVPDQFATLGEPLTIDLPSVYLSDPTCETTYTWTFTPDGQQEAFTFNVEPDNLQNGQVVFFSEANSSIAAYQLKVIFQMKADDISEIEPYVQEFNLIVSSETQLEEQEVPLNFTSPISEYEVVLVGQESWSYIIPSVPTELTDTRSIKIEYEIPEELNGLVVLNDEELSLATSPVASQVGSFILTFSITDLVTDEKVTQKMEFDVRLTFVPGVADCEDQTLSEDDRLDCEKDLELVLATIDNKGLITMIFSHEMVIPDKYGDLFNEYLHNENYYLNNTIDEQARDLQDWDSFLSIEYFPNSEDAQSRPMNYTWEITNYVSKTLNIQIIFSDARYVSTGEIEDNIVIVMQPNAFFVDRWRRNVDEVVTFRHRLPAQIQLDSPEVAIAEGLSSVSAGTKGVVIGNLILSFVLSASLNQLWALVEAEQIICMLPLIDIRLNAVTHVVILKFMEMANFDIIPIDKMYPTVFHMPVTEPYNRVLGEFEFEQTYFVYNVGSPIVLMVFILFVISIFIVVKYIPKCKCKPLRYIQKRVNFKLKTIHHTMFWSTPIVLLQETFMIVIFSILIHLLRPHSETVGQQINNWLAYFFTLTYFAGPFACVVFLILKFDKLKVRQYKLRYGTLYSQLDLTKKWPIALFRASFYARRFLVIVAILFAKKVCFQILILVLQVVLNIIVVGTADPYESRSRRFRELLNEFAIMTAVYHVMCFTPFVPDIDTRTYIGYSFIMLILTHTLFSVFGIIHTSAKEAMFKWLKRRVISNNLKKDAQVRKNRKDRDLNMARNYIIKRGDHSRYGLTQARVLPNGFICPDEIAQEEVSGVMTTQMKINPSVLGKHEIIKRIPALHRTKTKVRVKIVKGVRIEQIVEQVEIRSSSSSEELSINESLMSSFDVDQSPSQEVIQTNTSGPIKQIKKPTKSTRRRADGLIQDQKGNVFRPFDETKVVDQSKSFIYLDDPDLAQSSIADMFNVGDEFFKHEQFRSKPQHISRVTNNMSLSNIFSFEPENEPEEPLDSAKLDSAAKLIENDDESDKNTIDNIIDKFYRDNIDRPQDEKQRRTKPLGKNCIASKGSAMQGFEYEANGSNVTKGVNFNFRTVQRQIDHNRKMSSTRARAILNHNQFTPSMMQLGQVYPEPKVQRSNSRLKGHDQSQTRLKQGAAGVRMSELTETEAISLRRNAGDRVMATPNAYLASLDVYDREGCIMKRERTSVAVRTGETKVENDRQQTLRHIPTISIAPLLEMHPDTEEKRKSVERDKNMTKFKFNNLQKMVNKSNLFHQTRQLENEVEHAQNKPAAAKNPYGSMRERIRLNYGSNIQISPTGEVIRLGAKKYA